MPTQTFLHNNSPIDVNNTPSVISSWVLSTLTCFPPTDTWNCGIVKVNIVPYWWSYNRGSISHQCVQFRLVHKLVHYLYFITHLSPLVTNSKYTWYHCIEYDKGISTPAHILYCYNFLTPASDVCQKLLELCSTHNQRTFLFLYITSVDAKTKHEPKHTPNTTPTTKLRVRADERGGNERTTT